MFSRIDLEGSVYEPASVRRRPDGSSFVSFELLHQPPGAEPLWLFVTVPEGTPAPHRHARVKVCGALERQRWLSPYGPNDTVVQTVIAAAEIQVLVSSGTGAQGSSDRRT